MCSTWVTQVQLKDKQKMHNDYGSNLDQYFFLKCDKDENQIVLSKQVHPRWHIVLQRLETDT